MIAKADATNNTATKFWSYDRGDWKEIEVSLPVDGWLDRIGYYGSNDDDSGVILWEAHEDNDVTNRFPFVLEFSPNLHQVHAIFAADLPSFFELFSTMAQWKMAMNLESFSEQAGGYMSKKFQSEHGHDLTGYCHQCDPYRTERVAEARRKKAEADSKIA